MADVSIGNNTPSRIPYDSSSFYFVAVEGRADRFCVFGDFVITEMSKEGSMECGQMSPKIVVFITCELIHSPDGIDLKTECLEMR
jgi:hypothetical protein